jgi:hypothetical protein
MVARVIPNAPKRLEDKLLHLGPSRLYSSFNSQAAPNTA